MLQTTVTRNKRKLREMLQATNWSLTSSAARGNSLLGANYALFIASNNPQGFSLASYITSGIALHYGANVKTLCIALSAERRKLVREGRSRGIFTMNCCFTLCVLAATFVCLHAAPRLAGSDLLGKGGSGKYWSDCTKPSDHGKINSITITPNPPVKGQKLNITVNIAIDEKLTGGSVKVSLMYGFLPFYQHTFDLCELLQKVKKNCPVPRGILDITVETKISPDVPGGDYNGTAVATDQNNQEIFCIKLNYKF